jgi:cytochrome b subunit of formate dehydrogenase
MFYLDGYLNGRFRSAHMIEAARIENWKLFAMNGNEEYFDQGFIRLFYWYGIIPGLLYVASNVYLIWQSYRNRDYPLAVIIVAYAILSVTEAHLISVYLLRNYILIWLGYYWYRAFMEDKSYEGYIWQIKQFWKGKANESS